MRDTGRDHDSVMAARIGVPADTLTSPWDAMAHALAHGQQPTLPLGAVDPVGGAMLGRLPDSERQALVYALRQLRAQGIGSPVRLAALCHLLGDPSVPPPSPFWRAIVTGTLPDDLDRDRLSPWDAAELLIAGIDHPDLVAGAATDADSARRVVIARPELARHVELVQGTAEPGPAAEVVIRCPELRERLELIAAIARSPWAAEQVLIACPGVDDPRLWDAVMAVHPAAWQAVRAILATSGVAPPATWATVVTYPPAAVATLTRVPAARRRADVLAAARRVPMLVGWATAADPSCMDIPVLWDTVAGHADAAAVAVTVGRALRGRSALIAAIARGPRWVRWLEAQLEQGDGSPQDRRKRRRIERAGMISEMHATRMMWSRAAARVVIECPELRGRSDLIAVIGADVAAAAMTATQCPDLRERAEIITAIARDPRWVRWVLRQCPDLREHPELRAAVTRHPPSAIR